MVKNRRKRGKPTVEDIVRAARKASREEEIRLHGKLCSFKTTVVPSKKVYNRRESKKVDLS